MLFSLGMKYAPANDNEPETFSPIGLAALVILNRLRNERTLLEFAKEHHEETGNESDASDRKEERGASHSEAVAHGVKKIIAFEQRAAGIDQRPTRKRK